MGLTWYELREQGRLAFGGQTPGRALEAELLERFERHPGELQAAITRLGEKFTAGKVHTPWPIVLRELEAVEERLAVQASPAADVARLERLAEVWIRNAGGYVASELDLLDALVGPHGPLRAFSGDELLRSRLVERWRLERPRFERAELEQLERGRRHREHRERRLELERVGAAEVSQSPANTVCKPETEDEPHG